MQLRADTRAAERQLETELHLYNSSQRDRTPQSARYATGAWRTFSGAGFPTLADGFLGRRVSKAGVKVDPRKVQSIREWATPTSSSEVRRLIGDNSPKRR